MYSKCLQYNSVGKTPNVKKFFIFSMKLLLETDAIAAK